MMNYQHDVDKMYTYLRGYLVGADLSQSITALQFAREKHKNQTRKNGVPYIVHPLSMACYAVALGLKDDNIISTILLHDVVEDCGIDVNNLPVNELVKNAVKCMTLTTFKTDIDKMETKRRYYMELLNCKEAIICKALDRYNNLSDMPFALSADAIGKNVAETEFLLLPILKEAKEKWADLSDILFVLRTNIRTVNDILKLQYEKEYKYWLKEYATPEEYMEDNYIGNYSLDRIKHPVIDFDTVTSKRYLSVSPHIFISGIRGKAINPMNKKLLLNVLETTDDDIFLIDRYGDYKHLFNQIEDIECVDLSSSDYSINPMDIFDCKGNQELKKQQICSKIDFLYAFFSLLMNRSLSYEEKTIISIVCKKIYDSDNTTCLEDFLCELKTLNLNEVNLKKEIQNLTFALECFFNNNSKNFSKPNSIKRKRILYFPLDNFPTHMKDIICLLILEYLHTISGENHLKGKNTSIFLPHIMATPINLYTNDYMYHLSSLVKTSRRMACSIVFAESDIVNAFEKCPAILRNISSNILLGQSQQDKDFLQKAYGLSEKQVNFLLDSNINNALWLHDKQIDECVISN